MNRFDRYIHILSQATDVRLEDTPAFLNFPAEDGEVLYGERIFVGYRWYDKRKTAPLFPFGHGLSYTDFTYSDLELSSEQISEKDSVKVTVTVTNSGEVAGKEVVQLYVRDEKASVRRPEKELRGFRKVELAPGESRRVDFVLAERDFSFYSTRNGRWIAESGDFRLLVGASSRDIRLEQRLTLQSTQRLNYAFSEYSFFREFWSNPQLKPLLIELMPGWIGSQVADGQPLEAAVIQDFLPAELSAAEIDEIIAAASVLSCRQLPQSMPAAPATIAAVKPPVSASFRKFRRSAD